MATFTNMATLFYNNGSVNSNIVSGELREVLSVTKSAVPNSYTSGDTITYVVNLINTGTAAFNGLTASDNLGGYTFNETTVYPLTYVPNSAEYYINGIKQVSPTVNAGSPLTISGISVPAGGNTLIVYQARANSYAPLDTESEITNTITVSGGGLTSAISASETISSKTEAVLSITKAINPSVVTENGQLTYTFTVQNTGNTAASDNVTITDIFSPILNSITVTYNGRQWTAGTEYTYSAETGEFTTTAGSITVPSASYTQNTDGTFTITPGTVTLTVTGTI